MLKVVYYLKVLSNWCREKFSKSQCLEEALKFPSVVGSSLSGDVLSLPLARTSLVLVSMRATGMVVSILLHLLLAQTFFGLFVYLFQKTCDQYRKVLEENFYGRVPVLDLSLLENRTFVWLQAWITKNLRKTIPSSRHVSTAEK